MEELIYCAFQNIEAILQKIKECAKSQYTACYFGETQGFVVSNIGDGWHQNQDYIRFVNCKDEQDIEERLAIEIIENSQSYQQAYGWMCDVGIDSADGYFAEFGDQCGSNL